jgi:hypothetical protein
MPVYSVSLSRIVTDLLTCVIEIEAPDEESAQEQARDSDELDFQFHSQISAESPIVDDITQIKDDLT